MKRAIIIPISICLLTGCGTDMIDIPVQEQLQTSQKTEAELTAELEEKHASLSEEEFIRYMNTERKEELHLPDSAVYNPDIGEYYDSDLKKWNSEEQKYEFIHNPVQTDDLSSEAEFFTGEIPAEMQHEMDIFYAAMKEYYASNPELQMTSRLYWLDDTPALHRLAEQTASQYFSVWSEMLSCDNTDQELANYMINSVLQTHPKRILPATLTEAMQDLYKQANESVQKYGENITAEECILLKQDYGYMIAPALQDIGRLDLLPIDSTSLCQDPEQLAEFARYFS